MTHQQPVWPLNRRFDEALLYATHVHEGTFRKQTSIPYVAHLLAVCALVLEDGGSEDEAIAALLHDAVEDAGGSGRLEAIRTRFGDAVAAIVDGCSDTHDDPKPPWEPRKLKYVAQLSAEQNRAVRRVSLADKVHNLRAIVFDYRTHGEALWSRFSAGGDQQERYVASLLGAFRRPGDTGPLVGELQRLRDELRKLRAEKGAAAPAPPTLEPA